MGGLWPWKWVCGASSHAHSTEAAEPPAWGAELLVEGGTLLAPVPLCGVQELPQPCLKAKSPLGFQQPPPAPSHRAGGDKWNEQNQETAKSQPWPVLQRGVNGAGRGALALHHGRGRSLKP